MIEIGSISEGTLRNCDLIPTYINFIVENDSDVDSAEELLHEWPSELVDLVNEWLNGAETPASRELQFYVDMLDFELWTILMELAPDGLWFGSHIGDGALIGFWPNDRLEY